MKLLVLAAACAACGSQPQPATTPHPPHPPDPVDDTPAAPGPAPPSGPVTTFGPETLCVTHGSMRGLHVSDSSMRAVVRGSSGDAGAVEFAYDGPTKQVSHLKSGDVREQLGLKLRAEDGCNLVYVVWRFAPEAKVVVQVKRNPGEHTSAECSNGGYEMVQPMRQARVGRPAPGSTHTLEAAIDGDHLVARADGRVVWEGTLPDAARNLHGPLGVRTDNVEATVTLSGPAGSQRDDESRCHAVGAD